MEEQNQNSAQILEQLEQVITSADEEKAKNFLIDQFQKFPEDLQREISLAFLQEGLGKAVASKLEEQQTKSSSALEMCSLIKEELSQEE